jgi:hypothetical protein
MSRMEMNETVRVQGERERLERLRQMLESRSLPSEERPKLDTRPPMPLSADEIDERIRLAIDDHYKNYIFEIIVGVTARTLDEGASALQHAVRQFEAEIARLETELEKLRTAVITEPVESAETAAADSPRPT